MSRLSRWIIWTQSMAVPFMSSASTKNKSGLARKAAQTDFARGRISMLTPELFAARFPDAAIAEAPATPHFAAYRVDVADLGVTEALFTERGVSFGKGRGRLRINAPEAFGVVIEFSAAHAG